MYPSTLPGASIMKTEVACSIRAGTHYWNVSAYKPLWFVKATCCLYSFYSLLCVVILILKCCTFNLIITCKRMCCDYVFLFCLAPLFGKVYSCYVSKTEIKTMKLQNKPNMYSPIAVQPNQPIKEFYEISENTINVVHEVNWVLHWI